jgi:hypothetical protein
MSIIDVATFFEARYFPISMRGVGESWRAMKIFFSSANFGVSCSGFKQRESESCSAELSL